MNRDEFVKRYYEIAKRALAFSEKARKEGLLALEEDIDQEKVNNRDIFEYGLRFVIDGVDAIFIRNILSNIIEQEKDESMKTLKNIQMEAVLQIQSGTHPYLLQAMLNSFTDLSLNEDETRKSVGY
jgi:flagellar motor component MotA